MKTSKFSIILSFTFLITHGLFSQQEEVAVKTVIKEFNGNGSITLGKQGEIYINEYGTPNPDISGTGKHIYRVSAAGELTVLSESVSGAVGNAIGQDGTYYFNNGNSYYKSDFMAYKDGEMKKIATLEGFSGDILIDTTDTAFYIPSYTHPALRRVKLSGDVEDFITDDRLKGATGITYGEKNKMVVSNFSTGKIYTIEEDRTLVELASIPITYPGYVIGYITFFEGNYYATGYGSNKIYRIDSNGTVDVIAGSGEYIEKDGNGKEAGFITPNGIDIDPEKRRLYVSQNGNGKPASLRSIDLPKL